MPNRAVTMVDIQRLRDCLLSSSKWLGSSVVTGLCWDNATGLELANVSDNLFKAAVYDAVFNELTKEINKTLAQSGLGALDGFYLTEHARTPDGRRLGSVIIPRQTLSAGLLVDMDTVNFGILLSVVLPEVDVALRESVNARLPVQESPTTMQIGSNGAAKAPPPGEAASTGQVAAQAPDAAAPQPAAGERHDQSIASYDNSLGDDFGVGMELLGTVLENLDAGRPQPKHRDQEAVKREVKRNKRPKRGFWGMLRE